MKLNLGCGQFPLAGFWNVDRDTLPEEIRQWSESMPTPMIVGIPMEEFLPLLRDESVEAITVSHSLMYLRPPEIMRVLWHCRRVMRVNSVIRVTEDETSDPENVWHDAVSRLTAGGTAEMLREVGFVAAQVDPDVTNWRDDSLIQTYHGDPPRVFHVEGVK